MKSFLLVFILWLSVFACGCVDSDGNETDNYFICCANWDFNSRESSDIDYIDRRYADEIHDIDLFVYRTNEGLFVLRFNRGCDMSDSVFFTIYPQYEGKTETIFPNFYVADTNKPLFWREWTGFSLSKERKDYIISRLLSIDGMKELIDRHYLTYPSDGNDVYYIIPRRVVIVSRE